MDETLDTKVSDLRKKALEVTKKVAAERLNEAYGTGGTDREYGPEDTEVEDRMPLTLDLMTFALWLQAEGKANWTGDDLANATFDYTGEAY